MKLEGPLLSVVAWASTAAAWWDGGHMIIAAVANEHLLATNRSDVVQRINHLLSYQKLDYPGVSSLISAPLWPDHVACARGAFRFDLLCNGFHRFDNLKIFQPFHHSDVLYYPINPHRKNATTIIEEAYKIPGSATSLKQMVQALVPPEGSSFDNTEYGTPFMYDLYLRLFIHIFEDIHNPVHMTSSVSSLTNFEPDNTGIGIAASYSGATKCWAEAEAGVNSNTDMHSLWDAAFGTYCVAWPELTEQDAIAEAKELMTLYPIAGVSSPNAMFEEVMVESYNAAIEHVYGHGFSFEAEGPFVPTEEYISVNTEFIKKQFATAGYRLANYLEMIADNVPPAVLDYVDLKLTDYSASYRMGAVGAALVAVLAL